ncbi:hypothetical protein AB0H36_41550 [Kribbella sp. NPDC050820]|uniref:hypothetical protein n=1 Tax=Kribbella sp. NPDC050820 TaxID=3155408 RepID=UPI0033F600D1
MIRGLFALAAFVAAHSELPAPRVEASFSTALLDQWSAKRAVVDQVAAALGKTATDKPEVGFYEVETRFGPVRVGSTAITADQMAAHNAFMSYSDSVQPAQAPADAPGGAR